MKRMRMTGKSKRMGKKLRIVPMLVILLFGAVFVYAVPYAALLSSMLPFDKQSQPLTPLPRTPPGNHFSIKQRKTAELTNPHVEKEEHYTTAHHQLDANISTTVLVPSMALSENQRRHRSQAKRSEKEVIHDNPVGSPYAYSFVIGGCDPERPAYRNYLYDVLNSAYLLHKHGSTADIVTFIQLSSKSNHTVLPSEELRWLSDMNVKVKYIPKSNKETFYTLQLNKFRILGLTEYRRVIFMDADSMPTYNLDYLFKLSDAGPNSLLQSNLILAGSMEPANGGFFMLEPRKSALKDVTRIIQAKVAHNAERLKQGITKKKAAFDPVFGWGHTILPPDYWESNKGRSYNWTFHAPHSDQGLLYYYAKYILQNTTMVLAGRAQKWKTNITSGEPYLSEEIKNPFENYSNVVYDFSVKGMNCRRWTKGKGCPPPYSHFLHFTGDLKPWNLGVPSELEKDGNSTPVRLWWSTLTLLNAKLDIGMNDQLRNWTKGMPSVLGHLSNIDHSRHMTVDLDTD